MALQDGAETRYYLIIFTGVTQFILGTYCQFAGFSGDDYGSPQDSLQQGNGYYDERTLSAARADYGYDGYSAANQGQPTGLALNQGYNGGRYPLGSNPFTNYVGKFMGGYGHFAFPPHHPWFPYINPYIGLNYVGRYDKYKGKYQVYNGDYDGYIPSTTPAPTTTINYTGYGYGSGFGYGYG